ncbi:hypothetical protein [Burkholderia sp. Bp9004]|uniref:hypothetical protein n=1 Tax=Burkholderia sp. Bp9004 TaxID=2184559 RepID=UPI000F5E97EC|nr:hypothetical protein [Burkholderia sp. Bp9004]RQZ67552.1 hypothetical protein DIE08_14320 [Burkholderia sp. Bp9004]
MDWIPALLKHLAIARSAVVAAFLTATTLLLLPRVAPTYLPQLPVSWAPLLAAACLFSGCLLVIWGSEAAISIAKRYLAAARASRALKADLDRHELAVVQFLGCNPAEPMDLDRIDYAAAPTTRLELMVVVKELSDKGLVELNPFAPNLVTLTDVGRKRALEIQRSQRGNM